MTYSLGIIGHGFAGQLHREVAEEKDSPFHVAVLCDSNADNLLKVKDNYHCVTKIENTIAPDLDAIILATPTKLHLEHIKEIANLQRKKGSRGFCLLLEKPMGVNANEAEEIETILKAAHIRFMVGLTGRYHPEFVAAYDSFRKGEIGVLTGMQERIHFGIPKFPMQYVRKAHSGRGIVLENGIHTFDRVNFFGDRYVGSIIRVDGAEMGNSNLNGECEDYAFGTLVSHMGLRVPFSLRWTRHEEEDYVFQITGTEGRIAVHGFRSCEITQGKTTRTLYEHNTGTSLRDRHKPGFAAEQIAFADFISGTDPTLHCSDAKEAQKVVHLFYKSAVNKVKYV